jgi:hypothetical protein
MPSLNPRKERLKSLSSPSLRRCFSSGRCDFEHRGHVGRREKHKHILWVEGARSERKGFDARSCLFHFLGLCSSPLVSGARREGGGGWSPLLGPEAHNARERRPRLWEGKV